MKLVSLIALSTLAFASVSVAADMPKDKAPAGMEKKHGDHFKKADTNNDGSISKEEFMTRHEKKFVEIDANHDGKISNDEMKARHEAMKAKHGGQMKMDAAEMPAKAK